MRIVQIAPEIGPGSGVAGVAHNLERVWQQRGVDTARFTMTEARGDWLPRPGPGLRGRLAHLARVVWFSTVGTLLARRYLSRNPGVLAVCHNDALAGDVYVNHGLVQAAMRARGHYRLRMARNPLHLFTTLRDRRRYGPHGPHRLVVNLTAAEDRLLRELHPRLRTPTVVIGNGVDLVTFAPPSAAERHAARQELSLADDDVAVLFVGHEFSRKGLPVVLDALGLLPPEVKLVVVGGTPEMVANTSASADSAGIGERVTFVGQAPDPRPYLRASDMLTLPSAYEAYPLVVLEALACGVPVVATPSGSVPELVENGRNGFVVTAEPRAVADAITALAGLSREAVAVAARSSVEQRSWEAVAGEYLGVLRRLEAEDATRGAAT